MTRLLDEAVAAIRRLPASKQDEIARTLIGMSAAPGGISQEVHQPTSPGGDEAFRLWPRRKRPRENGASPSAPGPLR